MAWLRRRAADLDIAQQHRKSRPVQQQKVSATVLAYVEPLFLMPCGPPPEKFREILKIAVLVWNSVVLDEHLGTDYLSDLRARLQSLDDPRRRALMRALVDDLVDRKRSAFSEEKWMVGSWDIIPQPDGEVRVRIEARTLLPQAD